MSSATSTFEQDAVPEPKRWTVEQFIRFYETGELGGDADHFELLDGEILRKLGQNEPHVNCARLAARALRSVFGDRFDVSQQLAISLGEYTRLEPDITVLKGDATEFDGRPPTAADVALLVEIVDSRMDTARAKKVPIYAEHGIAEYWIVDLRSRAVEVRRSPRPEAGDWAETRIYAENEEITPTHAAEPVKVSDLLPRA